MEKVVERREPVVQKILGRTGRAQIEWRAHCLTCDEELERCPNGDIVEAAARIHARDLGHRVLVGYEIS